MCAVEKHFQLCDSPELILTLLLVCWSRFCCVDKLYASVNLDGWEPSDKMGRSPGRLVLGSVSLTLRRSEWADRF